MTSSRFLALVLVALSMFSSNAHARGRRMRTDRIVVKPRSGASTALLTAQIAGRGGQLRKRIVSTGRRDERSLDGLGLMTVDVDSADA